MRHWHRCARWRKRRLPCPFERELDHEDDDDDGERQSFNRAKSQVPGQVVPERAQAQAGVRAKNVIGRHAMRAPTLEFAPQSFIKMMQEIPRVPRPVTESIDRGLGGGFRPADIPAPVLERVRQLEGTPEPSRSGLGGAPPTSGGITSDSNSLGSIIEPLLAQASSQALSTTGSRTGMSRNQSLDDARQGAQEEQFFGEGIVDARGLPFADFLGPGALAAMAALWAHLGKRSRIIQIRGGLENLGRVPVGGRNVPAGGGKHFESTPGSRNPRAPKLQMATEALIDRLLQQGRNRIS